VVVFPLLSTSAAPKSAHTAANTSASRSRCSEVNTRRTAGEKIGGDTEVQCRVITLAKATGVDLGGTGSRSPPTVEVVANPRHLRSRARKLARAQRALSRRAPGSATRRKAPGLGGGGAP
jgi:hypothetical protein